MFDAKIERSGGLLTVSLKSEPLEALMKGLAADRKEQCFWADGTVAGPGVEATFENVSRWAVKASRLQAVCGAIPDVAVNTGAELMGDQGRYFSLLPLTFRGLGQGIKITPAIPYTVDTLKKWARDAAEIAHALLVSVQPVIITVSVRPPAEEATPRARP